MDFIYSYFHEWRVGLYQHLREIPTEILQSLVTDLRQTIERIANELDYREQHPAQPPR